MAEKKSIKETLSDILRLAESGAPGERENAQDLLSKLLKKYNLSIDDLTSEKRHLYWFSYSDKYERMLLVQLYAKTIDASEVHSYKGKDHSKKQGFELTQTEYFEMNEKYQLYRKTLKEELQLLTEAFFQKHNIFPEHGETGSENDRSLTPKERERILRMLEMKRSLQALPESRKARLLSRG